MNEVDNSEELVTVYEAPDAVGARIVAADLESEGIACQVSGENQGGFMGVPAVGVTVMVRASDVARARQVIEKDEPKPESTEQ